MTDPHAWVPDPDAIGDAVDAGPVPNRGQAMTSRTTRKAAPARPASGAQARPNVIHKVRNCGPCRAPLKLPTQPIVVHQPSPSSAASALRARESRHLTVPLGMPSHAPISLTP